jgi:FkbM family methyltransferase
MGLFPALFSLARRAGVDRLAGFDELFSRSYFVYKRWVEDPFYPVLAAHPELFQGGHVLDVGGNIGYNALLFAGELSPGFQVFSFEPEAQNVARFERRRRRHPLGDKVTLVESAVGAASGELSLRVNPEHPADHRIDAAGDVRVRVVSLDDFRAGLPAPAPISFVKIDVQGYEPAVLAGMTDLLADPALRAVAVEYAPSALRDSGFDDDACFAPLAGWHAHAIDLRRGITPVRTLPPAVPRRGYVDLLFTRATLG